MILKLIALVGYLVAAGWIYWLTARVQLLLSQVEQIVDRYHTAPGHPTEPVAYVPEPEPEPVAIVGPRRLVPPHPFPGPPNPMPPPPPPEDPDAFKKHLDAQFDEWSAWLDTVSLPAAAEPGRPEPT